MYNEYFLASPLIVISVLATAAMVIDALTKNRSVMFIFTFIALILSGAAAVYTMTVPGDIINNLNPNQLLTHSMLKFGGFSAFFDVLFCAAGLLTIFSARPYLEKEAQEKNEFYSLLLFSVSGMMLIAHTNNLLILFIGIEIMSVTFYILTGYYRHYTLSVEGALKYFLLGAFATGFLVYGIALIYGATGTFDTSLIAQKIRTGSFTQVYFSIGTGLLIVGLAFKSAAFPFHQWAPDVYHGAPTVVTGFMSTAGKSAALMGFIIIARSFFALDANNINIVNNSHTIQLIIAVISAGTMIIGNISALVQKNVKRMLAYSSVAHAGYLLMGIVANNTDGWNGILFYSAAYLFMQIGAFSIVSVIENQSGENLELKDYSGLMKSNPFLASLMAVFMFSLAGLPPFAGFFGKYYLFTAAIKAGFTWLTIVAVIATIISIYYYIGLIVYMFFYEPVREFAKTKSGLAAITIAISAIGVLLFGVFPSLIVNIADKL